MNKSLWLIESIQALLEDTIYKGSWYVSSEYDLNIPETHSKINFDGGTIAHLEYTCPNGYSFDGFMLNFYKNLLTDIKKGSTSIIHPHDKYVYRFNKVINALDLDNPKELKLAIQKGIIILDSVDDFYSKYDKSDFPVRSAILDILNIDKIMKSQYDGVTFTSYRRGKEEKTLGIFILPEHLKEYAEQNLELVDGYGVRYDTGISGNDNFTLPPEVEDNLANFTCKAGNKLKGAVKSWLKKNFKKPYSEITLYRGISIDFYKHTIQDKDAEIFEKLGVHFDMLHRGTEIISSLNTATSWSTVPQIARGFANYGSINILMRATVPVKKIIMDFNILPKRYLKSKFPYWTQNEVIVEGKIPATIIDITVKDSVLEELKEAGFDYVHNVGIVKR